MRNEDIWGPMDRNPQAGLHLLEASPTGLLHGVHQWAGEEMEP